MKYKGALLIGLIASTAMSSFVNAQVYSQLWGQDGERWSPQSRLPDFSFAGYQFGEKPLPTVEVVTNVEDFGATGDDDTDDTEAFKRAISETNEGALFIPEGRYIISDILWIKKSNIVLRGAGIDKTVLHITKELEDVRPNMGANTGGRVTSNYSWSGGFLWVKGAIRSKPIANVVSAHKRGAKTITVDSDPKVKVGQRVRILLEDDADKTLLTHVYSGDSGDISKLNKAITVEMVSRIVSIDDRQITLDRPFRWDIREEWKPRLRTFEPSVSEVGIENLAITFPARPYQGHFTERGMNAIEIGDASDCWIRNIKIKNSDSGIYLWGRFCTIDGLLIESDREVFRGDSGHHGVTMGYDSVLTNFDFQAKFIHDLTLGKLASGNVFKNGKGINLSFDHHKRAPYENLFCNIDVGAGTQIWRCGGGQKLGKHCGARGTFWNIRSRQNIAPPKPKFGPDSMNFVGVQTQSPSVTNLSGQWFEVIAPEALLPVDLHAAQLKRRLRQK